MTVGSLMVRPISLSDAKAFCAIMHRHQICGKQRPVQGHKFSLSVWCRERLCGVAIVGRPVARHLDDGLTLEVRRVATDGTRNSCSMLYAVAARAARAMGYERMLTYILASEPGASLRAAGCVRDDSIVIGRQWDTPSRPRQMVLVEDRQRWWAPWSKTKSVADADPS